MVALLLDHNADANLADEYDGETALTQAARAGSAQIGILHPPAPLETLSSTFASGPSSRSHPPDERWELGGKHRSDVRGAFTRAATLNPQIQGESSGGDSLTVSSERPSDTAAPPVYRHVLLHRHEWG
jgi:hypothetical protein